jgi:hypothetical protein
MLQYRPAPQIPPPSTSRRRVIALMVGAGGLAVLLLAGLVLSLYHLVHQPTSTSTPTPSSPVTSGPSGGSAAVARARDELAARAMPETGTGHEYGWPDLSTRDPGPPIVLPRPRGVDEFGVAHGFPRTPEGALAQLAAIDTAALQSGSLPGVRAVIAAWAAAGGPTARTWSGVRAMRSLLDSAGLSGAGSPNLTVTLTPAMGLIKGRVGDDFVVACVDFSVDITYGGTTTTAMVDCQRMLWQGGRWVIGPGAEPAPASQVWPGTDAALDAGFRDLARQ